MAKVVGAPLTAWNEGEHQSAAPDATSSIIELKLSRDAFLEARGAYSEAAKLSCCCDSCCVATSVPLTLLCMLMFVTLLIYVYHWIYLLLFVVFIATYATAALWPIVAMQEVNNAAAILNAAGKEEDFSLSKVDPDALWASLQKQAQFGDVLIFYGIFEAACTVLMVTI